MLKRMVTGESLLVTLTGQHSLTTSASTLIPVKRQARTQTYLRGRFVMPLTAILKETRKNPNISEKSLYDALIVIIKEASENSYVKEEEKLAI